MMHSVDQTDDIEPWPAQRKRRQMPLWQELPLLLVVAFCLAVLVRTFLVQMFFIPSASMEDTLREGDRVLVNKVVYHVREPRRGEVVVFRGTASWAPQSSVDSETGWLGRVVRTFGDLVGVSEPGEKDFIKRVIGLPGDRVKCCDEQDRVTVNGIALDESSYVVRDSPPEIPPSVGQCRSRRFNQVVVPPGHLFVMGDHRGDSLDSRCQGTVPIDNLIGRAMVIVWPKARWGSLSPPPSFSGLPIASAPPGRPANGPDQPVSFALVLPLLTLRLLGGPPGGRLSTSHRRLLS